jgi:hypothetical protein
MEVISDRTGAQGRPTSRHLAEAEFCHRIAIGAVQNTLKAEAQALSDWLKQTHAGMAQMSRKTVETCIRDAHRAWRNPK